MNKTTKAVLLSALVFPGAGHFFLKQYIAGLILLSASLGSLYYLITTAVDTAMQMTDKILSGAVQPDLAAITDMASQSMSAAETQAQTIATTILTIAWIYGIVDSYRVGRAQSKITEKNTQENKKRTQINANKRE